MLPENIPEQNDVVLGDRAQLPRQGAVLGTAGKARLIQEQLAKLNVGQECHYPGLPPIKAVTMATARLIKYEDQWFVQEGEVPVYQYVEPLSLTQSKVPLEMVWIPGGTFIMGSPQNEPHRFKNEGPQHRVTVQSCFMGRYPITQAQWQAVAAMPMVERQLNLKDTDRRMKQYPIVDVSWEDMVEFCQRLTHHSGRLYRLPSEAEWEYACREGTTTPFYFGEVISPDVVNFNPSVTYKNGQIAARYTGAMAKVGSKGYANGFGLYDMHGNAWELCADHWHDNYVGAPTDGRAWLSNDPQPARVRRGGSWILDAWSCRSARRVSDHPSSRIHRGSPDRNLYIGFRVVCCLET
ncbi:MAG: formylglycine-generating enzyme family protein [Cyanobacteria bacterium P01_F01_bin.150]